MIDGLIVDLFAGGGGVSLGIEMALGRSPDVAANHDPEAVAMHAANHPRTKHFIEDVRKLDIRAIVGDQVVGLLWLSPDCKHHSKAKGGKPVDRKIRGLAWEAVRWAAELPPHQRPRIICLENVQEFRDWGPLNKKNLPDKERKGWTYNRFKGRLRALGYVVDDRMIRAADHGAPTTRERLFLQARCDGRAISWPRPRNAKNGAGGLPAWRTAAECIDFSLPCPSIFLTGDDVKRLKLRIRRPLKEKTLRRVWRGVDRYVVKNPRPFIVPVTHGGDLRVHGVDEPLRTITGAHRGEHALVAPFLTEHANGSTQRTFHAAEPLRTQCAQVKGGHFALVAPFMVPRYGERAGQEPRARSVEQPAATIVPDRNGDTLVAVNICKHYGGFYQGAGSQVEMPLDTITGDDHNSLVASSLVKLKGTSRDGQPIDCPIHTIQAGGLHYAEVRAFLVKYHDNGGQWNDLLAPAPTVVANDSIGLVLVEGVPHVIGDIGMRMLTPRELYRCQSFPDSYIIDPLVPREVGKKNKRIKMVRLPADAQVRMCGNSVPPELARDVVFAAVTAPALEPDFEMAAD